MSLAKGLYVGRKEGSLSGRLPGKSSWRSHDGERPLRGEPLNPLRWLGEYESDPLSSLSLLLLGLSLLIVVLLEQSDTGLGTRDSGSFGHQAELHLGFYHHISGQLFFL